MIVPGRLAWKFILPMAVLIILASVTLGWFFVSHDVNLITHGLVDRGTSLARNLAYHLEYELQFATQQRLQELIQGVIKQEDVLYVIIQDANGRVRAEAKAAQLKAIPPLSAPRSPRHDMAPLGQATRVYTVSWEKDRIYEIVHPVNTRVGRGREEIGLTLGGEVQRIGSARLGMSLSLKRVDDTITNVKRTLGMVTALVIVVGVLVAVVLVRTIVRPVRELASAAQRIEEGELQSAVTIQSRDEIGDLAASFNRMAVALRSRESENARLFRQLDDTNRRLEAASRHKSQFLANMSHELRTPMNAIIGFSEILLNESAVSEDERREFQGNILTSGRHLLRLINDILDLSKVEAGKMTLSPERISVPEAVEGLLATLRPLAAKKQLDLVVTRDAALTALVADAGKFKQILYNLVSNAIKFTPPGGCVRLTATLLPGEARFAVTDTGIGIPTHEQERIFEEFHQVQANAAKEYQGTGLGLALAKQLVELHGGRIWLESEPGVGSTFVFSIPSAESPAVRQEEPSEPAGDGRPLVLVVEDDDKTRALLRFSLSGAGYRVDEARDGYEALDKAQALRPAVITLDIRLPRKDGWEVLRELKEHPATSDIPVVIVSIVDEIHRGFSLGAADYILKPFDREDLLRRLERCGLTAKAPGPPRSALVVVNEPVALAALAGTLTRAGFRTLSASSGRECVVLAVEHRPDVILLNLLMPEINVFTLMQQLRAHPETRDIPIFVVTARDLDEDGRRTLDNLAAAILEKGRFSTEELIAEIGRLIRPTRAPGAS